MIKKITNRKKLLPRSLKMRLALVGVVFVLLGLGIYFWDQPLIVPKNISVSNVSADSITLSWVTDSPKTTKVVLKEADAFQVLPILYNPVIWDDRDNEVAVKRKTHYMTFENLKPNTRYIARIYSGVRQVHLQKLTTGPDLESPQANLVKGKVFKTVGQPSEGALVYLRLVNKDGYESALMSGIAGEDGSWSIDISKARIRSLQKKFYDVHFSYRVIIENGEGQEYQAEVESGDESKLNIVLGL